MRSSSRVESVDVHQLVQAVAQGLGHQRVIRHLAVARDVFQAGELVRKDQRDQVLGVGGVH